MGDIYQKSTTNRYSRERCHGRKGACKHHRRWRDVSYVLSLSPVRASSSLRWIVWCYATADRRRPRAFWLRCRNGSTPGRSALTRPRSRFFHRTAPHAGLVCLAYWSREVKGGNPSGICGECGPTISPASLEAVNVTLFVTRVQAGACFPLGCWSGQRVGEGFLGFPVENDLRQTLPT